MDVGVGLDPFKEEKFSSVWMLSAEIIGHMLWVYSILALIACSTLKKKISMLDTHYYYISSI